jgi:polar amino acid transport system substrate-binding protein
MILRAILMILTLWLLAGCGGDSANRPGESTLDRIQRTGVVRIAYANEAPYGYRDTATGRVTGEAPEIARVVLKRLGVKKIETTLADFGQLISGLKAGRYDMIAAGMYITPQRCKQIDFSNPTYSIGEAFLVRKGNPKDLHSYEDIANSQDARLGVVGGTVEQTFADQVGVVDSRVVVFPDNATAIAGLRAGRIDAFAGTAMTVHDLLKKIDSDDIERASPFTQPRLDTGRARSYGAFGFRQADDDFRKAVNAQLAKFIGTTEHLKLVEPFGFTREDLPGDVTAQDLCKP